jgi:hypothetical protein
MKHPGGRPSDYDPRHITEMLEFFQNWEPFREVEKEVASGGRKVIIKEKLVNYPPTLNKYAIKLGIDRKTLRRWAEDNPEFRPTYDACKTIQEEWLSDRGTTGEYHAGFTQLMLTNHSDIKQKVTHEVTDARIEINIDKKDSEL